MLFLLSRKAWRPALWLAAFGCRFAYCNVNLQTLILAPLVIVLMLLPAAFDPPQPERSVDYGFAPQSAEYSSLFPPQTLQPPTPELFLVPQASSQFAAPGQAGVVPSIEFSNQGP